MSNLERNTKHTTTKPDSLTTEEQEVLASVLEAVRQIKFGYVQITIQDGRVVQIDRTEKQRFNNR